MKAHKHLEELFWIYINIGDPFQIHQWYWKRQSEHFALFLEEVK
jgi:hypothetical protein